MPHLPNLKSISVTLVMCVCSGIAFSQTKCQFTPNKERILNNENLGYFLKNMTDTFSLSTDKRAIPKYVIDQFYCLTEDSLFANQNEFFNSGCVQEPGVPRRQLKFYANNTSNVILLYKRGGISLNIVVLFMKFSGNKLADMWSGVVEPKIKSINELVGFLEQHRYSEGFDALNGDCLIY